MKVKSVMMVILILQLMVAIKPEKQTMTMLEAEDHIPLHPFALTVQQTEDHKVMIKVLEKPNVEMEGNTAQKSETMEVPQVQMAEVLLELLKTTISAQEEPSHLQIPEQNVK